MHIVVFPGWYPSKVDKLSGDFVQRHMEAVAGNCRVSVVFPVKSNAINKDDVVIIEKGNLTEIYHYYPSISSVKWIDAVFSFLRYNYLCFKAVKRLSKKEKVSFIYLYVLQKNHLLGLLLQWLRKIPYVISECSTFYIDGRFDRTSTVQKRILRYLFMKSASYHVVSQYLAAAIKSKLQLNTDAVVIANVVDTDLFYYNNDLSNDRIAFVHVSNMTPQKNVEGMLQAFAAVKKINPNFLLNLAGPATASVNELIEELCLSKQVVIWNERDYKEVAEIMQQSDVFVFFTRHETFGCVIIEANACGLPVIVTDLEVTRELVSDKFNGVFVENENVEDLTEKLLYMIGNIQQFDPLTISLNTRRRFNYERVGEQFFYWLSSIS